MQHHSNVKAKVDECFKALSAITDIRIKSDLWKFYRVVSRCWIELDNEVIVCRARCKFTTTYQDLEKKLYESITVFEQHSILAYLIHA